MIDRMSPLARMAALVLVVATSAPAADAPDDETLVAALRAGGLNIYFRHAETDWGQSDRVGGVGDWESCDPSRMRQLSEEGRETARRVGLAIRALAIPVGAVLSSPYCRCLETARLLGLGPVDTTLDVMNLRAASYAGGRAAVVANARRRLSSAPAPGTNTVIVAHGNVAREATPVYPGEGEGVVFRPGHGGGFSLIARLPLEAWERLAQTYGNDNAAAPGTAPETGPDGDAPAGARGGLAEGQRTRSRREAPPS
jgi:phosphohistidine phosphatase SixA